MPGGEFIPPPSLPSTAFSDSMTVENRLSMLHGGNARNSPSTASSTSSTSFELASDGNAEFDRKKNDIFANLGAIEQKHDAFVKASSSNKRMRDLADSCVKKDDSPNAGFDNRLFDEARKRSKESDGFASFRNIHKNVKDVMFEIKDGGEAGTSSSASASSSVSSFKMPQGVPSRNRGGSSSSYNRRRRDNRPEKPDFMKNPEKWKRYSLEDVKEVTESSNSAAAFAFLDDLKRRKEQEGEEGELMEEDGGCSKIVFKAPSSARDKREKKSARKVVVEEEEEEEEEEVVGREMVDDEGRRALKTKQDVVLKSEAKSEEGDLGNRNHGECSSSGIVVSGSLGSKFMMKEYVVGAKNPQGKTREKKEKPKIGKEIKLSHLDDEDDGEED